MAGDKLSSHYGFNGKFGDLITFLHPINFQHLILYNMFHNTFKVFITFSLIVLFSSSVFAQKAKKTETLVVKTAIYCDHCLQCETCGMKMKQELMYTKGVKSMDIE